MDNKVKVFISYSHQDETFVEEFKRHLSPLKNEDLVEEWYDRKILPGDDYQQKIDENLETADIICLFISPNFLNSKSCQKEMEKALELRSKRGIRVVPIILSPCGWKDVKGISKLLALPSDGKPVSTFKNRDEAWLDIYEGLKESIKKEMRVRNLQVTKEFESFLKSAEMLTAAHSQKERVFIDDIFVYPDLDKFRYIDEEEKVVNSQNLIDNILDYPKIVIIGESQSGKTTLCKIIFKELRKKNRIPVYLSDRKNRYRGKIENKVVQALLRQYKISKENLGGIDLEKVIPIVDDFHLAKNKEKLLKDLLKFSNCILVIDDMISLNIRDSALLSDFTFFRIRELKPSLRYELVKKWISLKGQEGIDYYKELDKRIRLINTALGKLIGKGIMPSYPFFILSVVFTYETFEKPLDQEITTLGYFYQAFIYFYLKKRGAQNDEIDIYMNFLTELAFYIYKKRKYELTPEDFRRFLEIYRLKYTLPIKDEILLNKLGLIFSKNTLNNYSFNYPYIYYFFAAKFLADHIEKEDIIKEIKNLMQNLHVEENAYIAVFLAQHSKSSKILDEVEQNAKYLFNKYEPATLFKDEVRFFDEKLNIIENIIEKAIRLPADSNPEQKRSEILKIEDQIEEEAEKTNIQDEEDDYMFKELKRAVRTGEVIGLIIRNRLGSLEKERLVQMFKNGMNIYLRILSSFFEMIKREEKQHELIDFISRQLKNFIAQKEEGGGIVDESEIKRAARVIFWNFNFIFVYSLIFKIIHSLGSDKLTEIIDIVDGEIQTPASFLIKHGILIWYNKNLQIENMANKISEKTFSKIARKALKLMVVDYASLHPINYKDRQRIESLLRIPQKRLPRIGLK